MKPAEQPWTIVSLFQEAVRGLEQGGIEEARRNVEWILEEVLQCRRIDLYSHPNRLVAPDDAARVWKMVRRRQAHEPVQYILGHTDFFGLTLEVTPDVLIPRPETEQVVEHALHLLRPYRRPRVLDVGTGSGCIPLAIRHERPDAEVFACDVSAPALAVARRNAERLGLPVSFIECDIRAADAQGQLPSQLDLLISNPPYIPDVESVSLAPEVVDHEPRMALFSGADPLFFYRRILAIGTYLLAPGGYLVFETHTSYTTDVVSLMTAKGFQGVQFLTDLAGHPRIVSGRYGAAHEPANVSPPASG